MARNSTMLVRTFVPFNNFFHSNCLFSSYTLPYIYLAEKAVGSTG